MMRYLSGGLRLKSFYLGTAGCVMLLGGVTAPAFAQDTPASGDQAAAASSETDGGDEIIVTAQKRSESVQRVPISVTVVSGEQITDRQIHDPSQLQFVAPSLAATSFNAAIGATNFAVRGIGTLSFSNTVEPSVSTVIDDVVMGRPEFGVANFADVASVEVLNGPQGMLFGKNASAGLVHIKTVNPKLDQFEAIGHASYGSVNTPKSGSEWVAQGTVNVPVSDTAAFRINGFYTDHSPLVRNKLDVPGSDFGQRQYGFKAKFRLRPSNSFDLVVAADYTESDGVGPGATTDRSLDPASPFVPLNAAVGIVAGPKNTYLSSNAPTNVHFKVGGVQANATYTFDSGHELTDIVAWRSFKAFNRFDVDDHQINIADTNIQHADYTQFTNELRLSSPLGGAFDYQFGLFFYSTRVESDTTIAGDLGLGPPPPPFASWLGLFRDTLLHSKSYAGFGQATYHITDQARLIAGGRVTHDDLDYRLHSSPNGSIIGLDGPVPFTSTNEVKNTNFSWRVIGQYDLATDAMAYLSYSRGYKGPGFNFDTAIVNPEIPESFEAGVKFKLLDRKLTLNLSAFHSKFTDFQAQGFNSANLAFTLVNAGSLKSDGFEAQMQAAVAPGLQLNAGLSYADTRFGSYINDQCYPGQVENCNVVTGVADSTGNALPNAPKWTATGGVNYEHDLSEALKLKTSASIYYRDKVNFSSNGNPNRVQNSYTLFDLSAGIGDPDERWSVSAFCRNCTDKRFVTYIEANPTVAATPSYGQQFGIQSFRTIGIAVDFRFR